VERFAVTDETSGGRQDHHRGRVDLVDPVGVGTQVRDGVQLRGKRGPDVGDGGLNHQTPTRCPDMYRSSNAKISGLFPTRMNPRSAVPATPNGASFILNKSSAVTSAAVLTASGTDGQPNTPLIWMASRCRHG